MALVIRKHLFGGERKDTDSTRDQDEGFTTVKTRQKKKFVLPMTSSQKEDRGRTCWWTRRTAPVDSAKKQR